MSDNDQNNNPETDSTPVEEPKQAPEPKPRDKAKELQRQLAELQSRYRDIDPDEYRALKQRLEEKEREAAENDPKKLEELFQRKITKLREEYETEKVSLKEQLEALAMTNKTLAVTDKVMSEIAGLFNQDALRWIKREVEESCDLGDDGSIVIKDDSGDVLYKGARPMTPKEYGELLAEKYPSLAKASGVGGAKDMTPGSRSTPRGSNKTPESWAELQAMPNAREVLERLKRENPAAVQKILKTISA